MLQKSIPCLLNTSSNENDISASNHLALCTIRVCRVLYFLNKGAVLIKQQDEHKPSKNSKTFRTLSYFSHIGVTMAASVLIGVLLSKTLDGLFGTSPWMLLLFTIHCRGCHKSLVQYEHGKRTTRTTRTIIKKEEWVYDIITISQEDDPYDINSIISVYSWVSTLLSLSGLSTILFGVCLGSGVSVIKVLLLEHTVNKALTLEEKSGTYTGFQHILRLLLSGVVLFLGALYHKSVCGVCSLVS